MHSSTHLSTLGERIKGQNMFRFNRVLIRETLPQRYALPGKITQGIMTLSVKSLP